MVAREISEMLGCGLTIASMRSLRRGKASKINHLAVNANSRPISVVRLTHALKGHGLKVERCSIRAVLRKVGRTKVAPLVIAAIQITVIDELPWPSSGHPKHREARAQIDGVIDTDPPMAIAF
jgi:hypothetical protein